MKIKGNEKYDYRLQSYSLRTGNSKCSTLTINAVQTTAWKNLSSKRLTCQMAHDRVDSILLCSRDGNGLGPSMGWVGLGRIFQHM